MKSFEEDIEYFESLISEGEILEATEFGFKLLNKYPDNSVLLDKVVDFLFKVGKGKNAINLILSLSQKKLKEGYIESAKSLLKKGLKYEPYNIRIRKLLSLIYEEKGLLYESFRIIFEGWKNCRNIQEKNEMRKEMILKLEKLISTAEELKKKM